MKTINFELSKRLSEAGLLDDIEIENTFTNIEGGIEYKTLTLEEVIECIKKPLWIETIYYELVISYDYKGFYKASYLAMVDGIYKKYNGKSFKGKTLLEAIENMLEYLLDNNLLTK